MADLSRPKTASIEWRLNSKGVLQPFPILVDAITKDDVTSLHWAALSMPYVGLKKIKTFTDDDGMKFTEETDEFRDEFEEQCDGKRMIEVIEMRKVRAAAIGDNDMIKYVEDRSLGKPTQHQTNLTATANWSDLTAWLGLEDANDPLPEPPDIKVIERKLSEDYIEDADVEDDDEDNVIHLTPEELKEYRLAGF